MLGNSPLSSEPLSTVTGLLSVVNVSVTGVTGTTQSYSVDQLNGTFFGFGALGTAPFGSAYQPLLVVTGDANTSLTGVEGTAQVNSVAVIADSNYTATGVEGTGQIGDAQAIADIVVPVFGVVGTTQSYSVDELNGTFFGFGPLGTAPFGSAYQPLLIVTGNADVAVTGVEATGATGDLTVTGTANVFLTGVFGTGEVGDVSVSGNTDVNVTGVAGVTYLSAALPFDGFLFGFSPFGVVPFAGSYDAQGAVVVVTGDANVAVIGIEGTGSVNSVAVTGAANVFPTGVFGTGQVGTVQAIADIVVPVTGVAAVAELSAKNRYLGGFFGFSPLGNTPFGGAYWQLSDVIVDVTGDANVFPTGVFGTGEIGDAFVGIGVEVFVTGVFGTGETGTTTEIGDANVPLTSVTGTGRIGRVRVDLDISVFVSGVQAVGQIGNVNILWLGIDTNQTPDWNAVNDAQMGTWTPVNDTQTSSWTPVDDAQTSGWTPVNDGNTVVWTKIEG